MHILALCFTTSALLAQAQVPGAPSPARPQTAQVAETPEALAQRQLDAYNAHDLNAFCAPYAEDVQVLDLDGKLRTSGMADFKARYQAAFQKFPEIHAKLVKRMALGNFVVDEEYLTGRGPEPFRAIAIYEIRNGRIAVVRFILEPPPVNR